MRVTVKILMPDETTERDFHLFDRQVDAFVAKIKRDGGTARIVPLQLGADLTAVLSRTGVDIATIK